MIMTLPINFGHRTEVSLISADSNIAGHSSHMNPGYIG